MSLEEQERKLANARQRQKEHPDRHDDVQINIDRLMREREEVYQKEKHEREMHTLMGDASNPDRRELMFDSYVTNMFQALLDGGQLDLADNPELLATHDSVVAMVRAFR